MSRNDFDDGILYREIGRRISNERDGKFTQSELAKLIGLTRVSLSNIEQGKQRIPLHTLLLLAHYLETSIAKLLPDEKFVQKVISDSDIMKTILSKTDREILQTSSDKMQDALKDVFTLATGR